MTALQARRPRPDRAFERLYERHVRDVYGYAYAVLNDRGDAEDVTQTTFTNAQRAFERGARPRSPRTWLIAIAHAICRQRFRHAARDRDDLADHPGNADLLPAVEDVRRALGGLPSDQRAALLMREVERRPYAEVAGALGLPVGEVETLVFLARRALREELERALACAQAELAISRRLDGRLGRSDGDRLREHLDACPDCAAFARGQQGRRAALGSLATVPLPTSLLTFRHPFEQPAR